MTELCTDARARSFTGKSDTTDSDLARIDVFEKIPSLGTEFHAQHRRLGCTPFLLAVGPVQVASHYVFGAEGILRLSYLYYGHSW